MNHRAGAFGLRIACAAWAVSATATAGGLYYGERGVRALARGGAFVAGADDASAIAFNPAGLTAADQELLVDAAYVGVSTTYKREAALPQVDPNTGQPTGDIFILNYPEVHGSTPFLPIPTIAFNQPIGSRASLAAGLWAPYAAVPSYPTSVAGQPAPQRYSLISLEGSALAIAGIYGAAIVVPGLSLGAGFEVMTGQLATEVVFGACIPERFVCAPEQPEYDSRSRLTAGTIVAPSGILGLTYDLLDDTRLGASFHLPYWINTSGELEMTMPSSVLFDGASQVGNQADVSLRVPWILRLGVQQAFGDTRVEAAYVHEHWSMHDEIAIEPDGVALEGVVGFPEAYALPAVAMPRGFVDTHSVRLGGEHRIDLGGVAVDARLGVMYESGAVPEELLSVAAFDVGKVLLGMGAGLHVTPELRLDVMYAHTFTGDTRVDPERAAIEPVNALDANPPAIPHRINGGSYSTSGNVVGLGVRYAFSERAPIEKVQPEVP